MNKASYTDIAKAICDTLEGKRGADLERAYKDIIRFLSGRRLLHVSGSILAKAEKMLDEKEGIIKAKVSSARKVSEESKKVLEEILKKRYKAGRIDFRESIDEEFIGGYRIEVGDEVIDNTIKGKIKKLQETLTR